MDMSKISQKTYKSFDSLKEDFNWYAHNCASVHRSNNKIVAAAKQLRTLVEAEIYNLLLCHECYKNAVIQPGVSMTTPCDPPHLPLWVDCIEYGFWPAKLMRWEENQMVTVRFFGDHTNSTVNSTRCYTFTKNVPRHEQGPSKGTAWNLALQVSSNLLINFGFKRNSILISIHLFRKLKHTSKTSSLNLLFLISHQLQTQLNQANSTIT